MVPGVIVAKPGVLAAATTAPPAAAAVTPQSPQSEGQQPIRLSIPERARTVTYVATAATLGTLSMEANEGTKGLPFGSYVDYILDDKVSRPSGGYDGDAAMVQDNAE